MAEAIPVELQKTEDGWQLLRGGEPYFILGAGGSHSLGALAEAGGNSIRTWDAENVRGEDDVGVILDEAQALGLTVTVGIWLGHERHGFDYDDPKQVSAQLERTRGFVQRYKDHPALLLWGIGNETEGFEDGDDPVIWKAVNDVAAMVKELDPNHPTMAVTAFVHGERIDFLHNRSPAIDIHGVNAYGGAQVVPELLREGGAIKPFVLTEFGPVGWWEMPTTEWGAPYEQTSTQKAAFYRESYEKGITSAPGQALGSYAFLWGNKMEATETWFGMFLPDGARLSAVDAMTEIWSGRMPDDLAPDTEPLGLDGEPRLDPGAVATVKAQTSDPEGGEIRAHWALRREPGEYQEGGDFRPRVPDVENTIIEGRVDGARIRMPEEPGAYRLFYYAYDPAGNAATASMPLFVEGEVRTPMPFPVYEDSFENMPWAPSGWMGGTEFLELELAHAADKREGSASIRMRYTGKFGWAGVAWQDPPNNWGDLDGGHDLSGANSLELWARGEYGGEKVSFGVGLLESDRAFPDSSITKLEGIVLTREWQKFTIPLEGKDLSSIKTGFFVSLTGRSSPVTIYLDSIRFVR